MKVWQRPLWLVVAAGLFLASCAGQSAYTYTGAGLGGAVGALTGAAIDYRNPWRGAAIGGVLGGAAGGIAGDAYGRSQAQPQGYYQQPQYNQRYSQQGPPAYQQNGYAGPAQEQPEDYSLTPPQSQAPAPGYSYRQAPAPYNGPNRSY